MKSFLANAFWLVMQLGLALGIGYISLEWVMETIVHARKEIIAPDLKGQHLRQAITTLAPLGLGLIRENEEFSAEVPAGTVLKQFPLAGTLVREGKILRIVTSQGSEKIAVPEFIGLTFRKAEIEIRAAQLTLGEVTEIYSLKRPKGTVMDQDPKPLAITEKGELINILVSLGEPPTEKLIIPDFIGKDLHQAKSWAQANAIEARVFEVWDAPNAPDRSIVQQNLKPDTIYERTPNEIGGLSLELTVARNLKSATNSRFLQYTLPEKPARQREIVLKVLSGGREQQIYRGIASPGETVRIPLGNATDAAIARCRIYLDGIFTEEKTWK